MDGPNAAAVQQRFDRIPITLALGLRLLSLGEGTATLLAPHDAAFDGIFRSFHGGLLMTVADTAACIAILTRAGAEAEVTTTDMNIRFLAPCRSDVTAAARLIKFGRTLCPVAVELHDAAGVLVALAQVTYMRL